MSGLELIARQEAARRAHDRMLESLIDYTPCSKLTVEDVKHIARWTQTLAFDACEDAAKATGAA